MSVEHLTSKKSSAQCALHTWMLPHESNINSRWSLSIHGRLLCALRMDASSHSSTALISVSEPVPRRLAHTANGGERYSFSMHACTQPSVR